MSEELTKVDSAIAGLSISPPKDEKKVKTHKRVTSTAEGVWNINDLEKEGIELEIAIETQKLNWKLNTSPASLEDKEALKKYLVTPPVKKIDLHFPLGLTVTARNLKGVTIKDALDAIYKQYKKKVGGPFHHPLEHRIPSALHVADDEMDKPILAGFEWDKEESWTSLIVHQKKEGAPPPKKSKKKGGEA